jgi:membrane glycosyltransferase
VSDKLRAASAPATGAAATPLRRDASPAERVFEVPADRVLQDWKAVHVRALAYLDALGVPESGREDVAAESIARALRAQSWQAGSDAIIETLRALRQVVPERYPNGRPPASAAMDEFLAWRLEEAIAGGSADAGCSAAALPRRHSGVLSSMPTLNRGSMVPSFDPHGLRRWFGRRRNGRGHAAARHAQTQRGHSAESRRSSYPWVRVAHRRRALLMVLVLIPSIIASGFMVNVLPHQGRTWLGAAIVVFFGALFGWISIGFWTALMGFFTLVGRPDRFAITHRTEDDTGKFAPGGRTAIVMPICEEPVDRVFAGLQAIYQSLERTGTLEHFDFFILSDSSNPTTWVKEEEAWLDWCRALNRFDKIFYRRRRVRLKRKSGNVADFCRRWGKDYRYMIMLDADSVMAGETLVALVRLMERHPDAGMIQTAPSAVNRRSLFARVQQFASRVYGPMFAAGLHFWQLGDGQYWGHNTIIRVAPFMALCGLPRLPGKPPLGGEIMSHDFVEAALMGRAGWSLWLAFDLPGSYEETPSTLLEEMKRDRRWCQGNLQHLRILPTKGLFGAHRALFINGVLSYVSALLWFGFLTLSTAEAIRNVLAEPNYFPSGPSLFPDWPVWRPNWALALMAVTGMILFLPKVLSVIMLVTRRQAYAYSGSAKLALSVLLEILLSSLFAPIRMVFHSKFVVQNLLGRTVSWGAQTREDDETGWWEAIRHHGLDTLFASVWGTTLYWLSPQYFWWVTPIVCGLILSIPISVLASRVRLGERARMWGLFTIPEESAPTVELRELDRNLGVAEQDATRIPPAEHDGFVRAAVDPYVNALHRALLGNSRALTNSVRAARRALLARALVDGPAALSVRERRILLSDPDMVDQLHERVWELPDQERAARWGRPGVAAFGTSETLPA